MSITESKRIPLRNIWNRVGQQIRESFLILSDIDFDIAKIYSDHHWDDVPEIFQEKIYNYLVKP